ncbi:MAG: lysine 5,6-aminomutase subunit alpha [Firmicutes bacterium]|nr:lysine 5,6-aminomutase subunit alpha [Bacillota bacterium]
MSGQSKLQGKLHLDERRADRARASARRIAGEMADFIEMHTTVTIERAVLRLFGVDGVTDYDVPLPNAVVDQLKAAGKLGKGAAYYFGNALVYHRLSPQTLAEEVGKGRIDLLAAPPQEPGAVREAVYGLAREQLGRIRAQRETRRKAIARLGQGREPYLYVIVATGNIYEDVVQARAAAKQGADIIAVIRSTGQSLLDYVPYGATTEGFGGTYATQENFRIMRKALDEVGKEIGRYIKLVNYCSGLCMPEIAVMGAFERLDMMLNDAMYGIIFRDINMQRTFVDQHFSRMINAYAGVVINTGEDNYLTTADAVAAAHTVLASQFINEQFALRAGLREEQIGLGHAFEIDPDLEDGFLYEVAQAEMAREIFPRAPLKYMPPTKHITGDIFRAYLVNGLFNLAGVMTGQGIQLLGMLTEAIHTPFLQDRFLGVENAKYVMNTARRLGEEITFREGGIIQRRAAEVLEKAAAMLAEIEGIGLMPAIERGMFADTPRLREGGKGLDGVARQEPGYLNPFAELMQRELAIPGLNTPGPAGISAPEGGDR